MKSLLVPLVILACGWCVAPKARGQAHDPSPTPPAASQDAGSKRPREFQGDDIGQVCRLLARQAKINLLIDDAVKGTLNVRLEDTSAMETIEAIVHLYKLSMTRDEKGIYYIAPGQSTDTLDLLANPTTTDRVAAYMHNLYSALIKEGFSSEEALQIVTGLDPSTMISALGKKPEPAAPK